MRKTLILAIIIALTSSTVTAVLLSRGNWTRYYNLTQRGRNILGEIIAKEPSNHASVVYSYTVSNETFTNRASSGIKLDSIQLGQKVNITYLPDNPSISCFCSPQEALKSETIFIIMASIFVPSAILIILTSLGLLKWKRTPR